MLKSILILVLLIGCTSSKENIILFDGFTIKLPSKYQYVKDNDYNKNFKRFLDENSLKSIVIENRMDRTWKNILQEFRKNGMILKNHNLYHTGYIPIHYYTYGEITMYIAYGKKNIAIFYEFDDIDEVKKILKI